MAVPLVGKHGHSCSKAGQKKTLGNPIVPDSTYVLAGDISSGLGLFLKSPETFRAYFASSNFAILLVFLTLKVLKDNLLNKSGLQFENR